MTKLIRLKKIWTFNEYLQGYDDEGAQYMIYFVNILYIKATKDMKDVIIQDRFIVTFEEWKKASSDIRVRRNKREERLKND